MKNKKPIANRSKIFKALIFIAFSLSFISAKAQFSEFYGQIANDSDKTCLEFVTCHSVDEDYNYVGVQAYEEISSQSSLPHYRIRGVMIKDDGTLYTSDFYEINEATEEYDIVPLKIIPLENNSGYVITGYAKTLGAHPFFGYSVPFPFVITTDAALSPTLFRVFSDYGFFTDVDELSNGDFLFSGSWTNSLNLRTNPRSAVLMRTNSSFVPQLTRVIVLFGALPTRPKLNIINDAVAIDNDEVIICGTLTDECDLDPPSTDDTTMSRIIVGRYNFTNGTLTWHKCQFKGNFISVRMAVDIPNDKIAVVIHAVEPSNAAIVHYDLSGNFVLSEYFEFSQIATPIKIDGGTQNGITFNTHIPFVQNIYFRSDGKLFLSGKFVKLSSNLGYIPRYDMPWSAVYEPGTPRTPGTISNGILYKNREEFRGRPFDFVTFYRINTYASCRGPFWPLWAASNTVPRISGTDEFVTITNGYAERIGPYYKGHKCWAFTTDLYSCGAVEIEGSVTQFDPSQHIDASIHENAPADYDDLDETEDNVDAYEWECEQD